MRPRPRDLSSCAVLLSVLFLSIAAAAQSGDWPQWGGPTRDFKSDVTGLAASWPDTGPRRIWSRPLGEGYSPIAAVAGTLYTMYRTGDREAVVALEAASGRTVWEHVYEAPFVVAGREADEVREYHLEKGPGPMATPLVIDGVLFAAGASGRFHALDARTGKVLWEHDLIRGLQGFVRQRGYTCSPIAYKDTVVVPVGAVGASIVAFNRRDGSIAWKRHDFKHAYASPILIDVDGQPQLVIFMLDSVVGVDPENGDLLWRHPTTDQGTNVSTPVWGDDNLLFVSASYGYGSHALELKRTGKTTAVREIWGSLRVRLHFTNAVRVGPVIYGSSGDFGPAFFTALDARTGRTLWQDRRLPRGSFVYADGRFILVGEDGTLVLATPSPGGLVINAQAQVLESNAWTPPTLAGTTLYLRDRKNISAFDLR